MKRALITGIGGQDGSYLAELLLDEGYVVFGTTRRSSGNNTKRIDHIRNRLAKVYPVELTDARSVEYAIDDCDPHEIYHEADQDNVGWSRSTPNYSVDVTVGGVTTLLEYLRFRNSSKCKVFIPVSATMFGNTPGPQNEDTPHHPNSPYACAKSHVYHLARHYRDHYGLFVSTAILYNHHSERRKQWDYLIGSIFRQVQEVRDGKRDKVRVGSLEQVVDIGYAAEFVTGIYRMMQLDKPVDLVLGTGRGYKIQDIVCAYLNIALCGTTNRIELDPSFRKSDECLVADISRAREMIGWNPQVTALELYSILDRNLNAGVQ